MGTNVLTRDMLLGKGKNAEDKSFNILFYVLMGVLLIVLFLRTCVFTNICVSGNSMNPTLNTGDYLIGNRLAVNLGLYDYGDVVVINTDDEGGKKLIKRVIAKEGDVVKIQGGAVWRKTRGTDEFVKLDEPYVSGPVPESYEGIVVEIEKDMIFVLGDNRKNSTDSLDPVYMNKLKAEWVYAVVPEWAIKYKNTSLASGCAGKTTE